MFAGILPSTTDRVPLNTADIYNERIRQDAERRVAQCARLGRTAIDERLKDLDEEWDIERTLEANAASVTMITSALGFLVDRRFFLFPIAVGGFLLLHAAQGWCPPLPALRSMGVRTQSEIDEEKYALKALRGDFAAASSGSQPGNRSPSEAVAAARRWLLFFKA